jgi:hypothetical protein
MINIVETVRISPAGKLGGAGVLGRIIAFCRRFRPG